MTSEERLRAQKRRLRNIEWAAAIKEQRQCYLCPEGVWWPSVALDFDHLSRKKERVSLLARSASLQTIATEIAKCQVVCASHHRMLTQQRKQFGPGAPDKSDGQVSLDL